MTSCLQEVYFRIKLYGLDLFTLAHNRSSEDKVILSISETNLQQSTAEVAADLLNLSTSDYILLNIDFYCTVIDTS